MAIIAVADGETQTVADGETAEGGPILLDGTLALDGTLEAGEATATTTVTAGATATGVPAKEKAVQTAVTVGSDIGRIWTVADGETITRRDGSDEIATQVRLDGTVNLDGELRFETSTAPSAEKDTATAVTAGAAMTGDTDGEKDVRTTVEAGAIAINVIKGVRPLRRRTTTEIDNTRRTDYSTQGTGETTGD